MSTKTKSVHPGTRFWANLPRVAKCIVATPLTLVLLGAEVTLRLSPKLDVILTAAAIWVLWAWIGN